MVPEIFAKENRFAFFNSGAIGWMVSEEPLVKKLNLKWLDMLKLRASYGQIGDDNVSGRWLYMDTWSNGGSYRQSLSGCRSFQEPLQLVATEPACNKNLQWETANQT